MRSLWLLHGDLPTPARVVDDGTLHRAPGHPAFSRIVAEVGRGLNAR